MFIALIKQRDLANSFAMCLIWEAFTGMDVISGVVHAYMGVGRWGGMVDGGNKNPVSEKHLSMQLALAIRQTAKCGDALHLQNCVKAGLTISSHSITAFMSASMILSNKIYFICV